MNTHDKKILQKFASKIRTRRGELLLSQLKLAEIIDVHVNAVGRIERGQVNPSLTMIIKLAKGLKIDPCELVENLNF